MLALLVTLACGKRIGDLHALSSNTACFTPHEAAAVPHPLCLVHTLQVYVDRSSQFNFEGRRKGLPVSKQLLSHSFDEAIALAYASKNETCPFVVCAHYTKISGVPLRLAFWA